MNTRFQTPLARARGLGSARTGTHHWWLQRVSALALLPLVIWFAVALACLPGVSYERLLAWINQPYNAILLIALLLAGFYHAMLGLQVIIEDYVHGKWLKLLSILGLNLGIAFLLVASVFAVLRIVFTG